MCYLRKIKNILSIQYCYYNNITNVKKKIFINKINLLKNVAWRV